MGGDIALPPRRPQPGGPPSRHVPPTVCECAPDRSRVTPPLPRPTGVRRTGRREEESNSPGTKVRPLGPIKIPYRKRVGFTSSLGSDRSLTGRTLETTQRTLLRESTNEKTTEKGRQREKEKQRKGGETEKESETEKDRHAESERQRKRDRERRRKRGGGGEREREGERRERQGG